MTWKGRVQCAHLGSKTKYENATSGPNVRRGGVNNWVQNTIEGHWVSGKEKESITGDEPAKGNRL
jgi:hypothetical protein